jgi:hypothetical protein
VDLRTVLALFVLYGRMPAPIRLPQLPLLLFGTPRRLAKSNAYNPLRIAREFFNFGGNKRPVPSLGRM